MSAVHVVGLIGVENVGGEEHGEQEQDPGRVGESLPQSHKLSAPRWVLHQNDLGVILTNNFVGIDKEEGKNGTKEHEDDKSSVGAIRDGTSGLVDVLSQRNLCNRVS